MIEIPADFTYKYVRRGDFISENIIHWIYLHYFDIDMLYIPFVSTCCRFSVELYIARSHSICR